MEEVEENEGNTTESGKANGGVIAGAIIGSLGALGAMGTLILVVLAILLPLLALIFITIGVLYYKKLLCFKKPEQKAKIEAGKLQEDADGRP